MRSSPALLALLLTAGCRTGAPPPDYRFELDGKAMQPDCVSVEGDGERPAPGDVLTWPFVVLDDVADQSYQHVEGAPSGRFYRRTPRGLQLVALTVGCAEDLAALRDEEAAGLRGIEFDTWNEAVARQLARVDLRRCILKWRPLCELVDLAQVPATARYLDLHYGKPVDPAGLQRFRELRYLAVPDEAPIAEDEPPPPVFGEPGPPIALDWVRALPELRWLDVDGVGGDLRPLGGHLHLRTVRASHCRLTHLPGQRLPALREFRAPFSDAPEDEVARLRALHPAARILTTPREALLDCIGAAVRLQLRTGSSCHPQPTDRVVYATADRAELQALFALLQLDRGYVPAMFIPGCDRGVMQFFDADGALLAEVGMFGPGPLRCYRAWSRQPASIASVADAEALQHWLAARGLRVGD